jgi:hypothetical protein
VLPPDWNSEPPEGYYVSRSTTNRGIAGFRAIPVDGDLPAAMELIRTVNVPQPVPAKLFWSVTVYDAETRSQIRTDQGIAALRSMFELAEVGRAGAVDLHFGPKARPDAEGRWIKTIPGKGWFVYFRIYGPEEPAFDGSWRLSDFEAVD